MGLFLLIGAGYAAVRLKLLPASASQGFTSLLLRITLPFTIFTSMLRPFDPGFLRDGALVVGISFLLFLLYAALSLWLSARLFSVPAGRRGTWMLCATFCNNGFMGFPVAYALFGDEGLALAAVLGIPFNLLMYSLGLWQLSLDREDGRRAGFSWRSVLLNNINIALFLGLIAYLTQLPIPQLLLTPMEHLSNITTPLSMLITGMSLAVHPLSDLFRDRDAVTCSCTRLVLFPLLSWLLLLPLPLANPLVGQVILVIMSMPSAAVTTALAQRYQGSEELAARSVCLSALLCTVTLPLISLLL